MIVSSKAYTDRLFSASKEGRKIKLQIEALQTQIKKLRRHGKTLNERSAIKNREMQDASVAYAKQSCLELSSKIQNTFPREVRDLIYSHITGCGTVAISQKHIPGGKKSRVFSYFDTTSETELRGRSLDQLCEDHWWNEGFVGAPMRREIGENYYQSSFFQFGDSFDVIPRFRVTDQWRLGFLPVSYIGKVKVSIECREYMYENSWTNKIDELDMSPKGPGSKLLVHLESLFGFKPGTAITIKINPRQSTKFTIIEQQEWMCTNILRCIFPVLQRLKDMNCKVRAILNGGTCSSFAVAPFATEWNLVSYEAVTGAFWKVSATLLLTV